MPRPFAAAAVALVLSTAALAQAPDRPVPTGLWLGGAGLFMVQPQWVGGGLSVGVERGAVAARIGFAGSTEFWGATTVNAVSVAAGGRQRLGPLELAALAGPAVVWGTDEDREPYRRVGAATEVSALVMLGSRVRVGLEGRATTNGAAVSVGGGPALRVRLGPSGPARRGAHYDG